MSLLDPQTLDECRRKWILDEQAQANDDDLGAEYHAWKRTYELQDRIEALEADKAITGDKGEEDMNILAKIKFQGKECSIVETSTLEQQNDWNTGHLNTGHYNPGYYNTGDRNTGHWNTGDWNTGNRNTGHYNTGYYNTGNWNTGDRNTGSRNTGNRNTGNWNTGNYNTGFFNTTEPTLMFFNKPTNLTILELGDIFPDFLRFQLTEWIYEQNMSEEEKKNNPSYKCTNGYLKVYDYQEAVRKAWDGSEREEQEKALQLPNFDNEIFKEIFGIDVIEELKK